MTEHQYIILRTETIDELEDLVNEYILLGYTPHGSIAIRQEKIRYYQPMLKCEK